MTVLAASESGIRARSVSTFEFWPSWLFYIPIVIFWIVMGVRYRSFTLPTAANPRVETGGLCGERKSTILDQAGPQATAWIASYVVFRTGSNDVARATKLIETTGLVFPMVIKPNIGCNGAGVRLVQSHDAMTSVLAAFPRDVELVLQEFVKSEGEAGIFYVRRPDEECGHITSLTFKQPPILLGDGRSTIAELILRDDRSRRTRNMYLPRFKDRLQEVLPAGDPLRLVFAGNHCKGSIFSDGGQDIARALTRRIDMIMKDIPDFHFGRLDVRFESRPALRNGEQFRIIEINGVGSEATHIWDPSARLSSAYRDQFNHYRIAFEIGADMRRRGEEPTRFMELLAQWRLQRRLMAAYPLND